MAERNNRVAEDVVEYFLFPGSSGEAGTNDSDDSIEETLRNYMTSLSPLLINVVWQNEAFKLKPVKESGNVPTHLHGDTNFGENIEDEWFIVYLLYEMTRRFPGLVARVHDSDEEFLLIEAADVLPKWLNPESAENRVYIYNGELHIIPVPQTPADVAIFPQTIHSVGDAVECIRTYPDQTRASQRIQTAVNSRLNKFPDIVKEHVHYTHCYIPASIAAILDERPQLVSAAVRAFYYRDPIDLKCCRTFTYFRPGTRVIHRTQLTRCLYAQLVHQNFQPDKRSGWVIPNSSNPKFRSHDLGMKLAHGFEILCNKCGGVAADVSTQDVAARSSNVRWQQYVQALHNTNYFRGELEGSRLYKKLLDDAWQFYRDNMTQTDKCNDVGSEILHLLKTLPVDVEERRRAEQYLQSPDDDSWLTLNPDSLDAMMNERSGNLDNDDDPDGVFDLGKVADSMKSFVKKISSVDGAEFPSGIGEEDDDGDIQFDGSGFITAMQEMFEFEDSGSDSSSGMDEYGWEDVEDDDKSDSTKPGKIKRPPSLDQYMDIMDRELAKTDVGKSFEKHSSKSPSRKQDKDQPTKAKCRKDIDEEDDDFQPVNVDLNAVKNLLESYGAQDGLAGPTSNILGSMGVFIPPNKDNMANGDRNTGKKPPVGEKPTVKSRPAPPARPASSSRTPPSRPTPPARPPRPRARIDSKETDV